ncbi:hypothetical protein P7C73_g2232, partial [Tremellales sp. Uapishka_1]
MWITKLYLSWIVVSSIPSALARPTEQLVLGNAPDPFVLPPKVTDYIETLRTRWNISGISLAIVLSPNYTYPDHAAPVGEWQQETFAFGDADGAGTKVTENSLFALASNSKLFTATAVNLLVHNKTLLPNGELLDWSTKVKDILPDWQLADPYASDHVDVLDLMSMRSGMPRHDTSHDSRTTPLASIQSMRYLKPSTEIRQTWQYNNFHYLALSHMIPTLTNISFVDYVKRRILDPLGMSSTTYNCLEARQSGQRSEGFVRVERNAKKCEALDIDRKVDKACTGVPESLGWWTEGDGLSEAGMGGLISSSKDLTKWLKELIHPSVIPRYLIEKTSTSLMTQSSPTPWREVGSSTYGQGSMSFAYRSTPIVHHGGSLPGQKSQVTRVPSLGFAFATMVNDDEYGSLFHEIIEYRLLDHLLGLEPIDWEQRLAAPILSPHKRHADLPKHPSPPKPGFDQVPGTYTQAAYGSFTLESFDAASSSPELTAFYARLLEQPGLNLTGPIFVGKLHKTFATHIALTHFDGNLYNRTTVSIYTSPQSGSPVVTEADLGSVVVDEGVGMFSNWFGAGAAVPILHAFHGERELVKEKSETWYEKVG